jgi:hypothetical protein
VLRVPEAQAAAFRPRPPPLWTASDAIRQITVSRCMKVCDSSAVAQVTARNVRIGRFILSRLLQT